MSQTVWKYPNSNNLIQPPVYNLSFLSHNGSGSSLYSFKLRTGVMLLSSWEQKTRWRTLELSGEAEPESQLKTEWKLHFRDWGCCFASLKRTGVVRYLWILPHIQVDFSHNSSSHRSTVLYRTHLSFLMSMQFRLNCPLRGSEPMTWW